MVYIVHIIWAIWYNIIYLNGWLNLTSTKISLYFSLQVRRRWMHLDKNFKIDLDFHQGNENQVEKDKDPENLLWKIYRELI